MPFKSKLDKYLIAVIHPGTGVFILMLVVLWVMLISYAHYSLNSGRKGTAARDIEVVRIGYMPVVANIAAPLIDASSRNSENLRIESIKFASFADMGEALRNNHIHAAFIIAPLSIVLRQQGEDIKIVFIGSRHESTLVGRNDLKYNDFSSLTGKTVAVPMRFSGHHLDLLRLADQYGIRGRIDIVEMNPPDMPPALARGGLDAYYVGEPFAAQSVMGGQSQVLHYVEESWPNFLCNLMIMQNSFLSSRPDTAEAIVQAAVRASLWVKKNPVEAAAILQPYWSQSITLIEHVLTTPPDRIKHDRFLPSKEEVQHMADVMHRYGLIGNSNIDGIVFDTFVLAADVSNIEGFESIMTTTKDSEVSTVEGIDRTDKHTGEGI